MRNMREIFWYIILSILKLKIVWGQSGAAQMLSQVGSSSSGSYGFGSMNNGANKGGLPPGYANIRGEIMNMNNKLLQRITAGGTNYYTYENQDGNPLFRRREVDSNRRFVLFPDAKYPQGDGHYIVLRRMPGMVLPSPIPSAVYESFRLSLGDSVHAYVTEFQKEDKPEVNHNSFNGLAASYGGATSGYGMTQPQAPFSNFLLGRKKRKSISSLEVEMTPIDFQKIGQDVVE